TGKRIETIPAHSKSVVSVAFHPEGKHLASRGADRKVRVWDLTTRQEVFSDDVTDTRPFGSAFTIAFSADGRLLASALCSPDFPTDGVVNVWDWENHQLLHSLRGHNFHTTAVAFSGDGRLATGTYRDGLNLWDPQTGKPLRTVAAHDIPISAVAFSA